MKKLMMIAVMAVVCLTANAQNSRHEAGTFTLQPMFGLSAGGMRGEEKINGVTITYDNQKWRWCVVAGAEAEYYTRTHWLTFSGGLLYQMQGWKIKNVDAAYKVDFINIPLLANFYVAKGFALKAGLQPGFVVSAKQDGESFSSNCNTVQLSIPLGLSYEFTNGITLNLRANVAVTKLNKNNDDIKYYNDGYMLTVGYKFGL